MTTNALIALGSNQPWRDLSPLSVLESAVRMLGDSGLIIGESSRYFATPCHPVGAGPDFVNATISVSGLSSARALLAVLHETEQRFGRVREKRWGERSVDLDLLAFGDTVLPDRATQTAWRTLPPEKQQHVAPDRLILPHPRMQDRAFVLVPLADIAPHWIHPVTGLSVLDMLEALPEDEKRAISPL